MLQFSYLIISAFDFCLTNRAFRCGWVVGFLRLGVSFLRKSNRVNWFFSRTQSSPKLKAQCRHAPLLHEIRPRRLSQVANDLSWYQQTSQLLKNNQMTSLFNWEANQLPLWAAPGRASRKQCRTATRTSWQIETAPPCQSDGYRTLTARDSFLWKVNKNCKMVWI